MFIVIIILKLQTEGPHSSLGKGPSITFITLSVVPLCIAYNRDLTNLLGIEFPQHTPSEPKIKETIE